MLLMRKEYFAAIRSGAKTTTLRYWKRPRVRPGSVHTVRGLGRLRIDEVAPVAAADLGDADAEADGFRTPRELRQALRALYPAGRRAGGPASPP